MKYKILPEVKNVSSCPILLTVLPSVSFAGDITAESDLDWLKVLVGGEKQAYHAVGLGVRQNIFSEHLNNVWNVYCVTTTGTSTL